MPFGLVLLEPVRSAEPPIISGAAAVKASIAFSEAMRLAISFGAAASFSFTSRTAAAILSGRQVAADAALEFGALLGRQRGETLEPSLARALAALAGPPPGGAHVAAASRRRAGPSPAARARP